ncbi:MAG: phasin family protein [Bacteroidales bacterium]
MTTTTATPKAKAKPARTTKPAAAATEAATVAEPAAAETAPVTEATQVVEQAVSAGKDAIEQVVKASQDAAAKGYDKALAAAKDQVEAAQKVQAQAVKSSEEALASAKENLDAVVKASQLLAQGLQDLSKSVFTLTQEAVEDSMANTKKLLAAKTLHEAVDLHSAHAKAQIERMLAEGTRLTDSTRKLFEEALTPIQDRLHATVEKLTKINRR